MNSYTHELKVLHPPIKLMKVCPYYIIVSSKEGYFKIKIPIWYNEETLKKRGVIKEKERLVINIWKKIDKDRALAELV